MVTNAEGFEIRQLQRRGVGLIFRDRISFTLVGVMQLIAVAIIAKQLKILGILPKWVDTDVSSVCVSTAFWFTPHSALLLWSLVSACSPYPLATGESHR